jgi:hypothetical protein
MARSKDALLPTLLVLLFILPGCDHVRWGGVEIDVRPPDPVPSSFEEPEDTEVERPPEPIVSGPLVYLVERDGGWGRVLPVAEWKAGAYVPIPAPDETPEWVERFPLERWERGTEFVLYDRGVRAGTLVADGTASWEEGRCLARPVGRGRLELRPEAASIGSFLAFRKADLSAFGEAVEPELPAPWPAVAQGNELTSGAQTVARFVLTRASIPFPPSIPELVKARSGVMLSSGTPGLAASYVFGGALDVGAGLPGGYGLFILAAADPSVASGWVPQWIWYQPNRQGKAVPQLLAGGPLPVSGPRNEDGDLPSAFVLEVYGTNERSLALLGQRDGSWDLLYQDACGTPPAAGAARPWR